MIDYQYVENLKLLYFQVHTFFDNSSSVLIIQTLQKKERHNVEDFMKLLSSEYKKYHRKQASDLILKYTELNCCYQ